MSIINVDDLTFSYDGSSEDLFRNVSFRIDTDWKLGFTGRNGRGKTTFMKLLMGEFEYTGRITSSVRFRYFPFAVDDPELLAADIAAEMCPDAENWQIVRELSLLDVPADVLWRPYSTLSGGEKTKLQLALLFLTDNCFMLIDEPTNHLDQNGRMILSRYLKSKKGFILVSHDRNVLDECTDHTLSINRCCIDVEAGNYSSWEKNKEARDSFEYTQNIRLKKEIKKLEASAKAASEHSDRIARTKIGFDPVKTEKSLTRRCTVAKKARKLMDRAKVMEARIEKDIEKKEALLKNIETTAPLRLPVMKFHSRKLLCVNGVSVSYGDAPVCSDVRFDISEGEAVALTGRNGCGKSSLIRLICGEDVPHTGEIIMNQQLVISLISQDTSGLHGDLSDLAAERNIDESLFKAVLRKLDLPRELFSRDISGFSDGQKKKVMIAASLCTPAHLYIWDEPLNFIDIWSRRQIEELIKESSPAMLIVEHDEVFRRNIGARDILMR